MIKVGDEFEIKAYDNDELNYHIKFKIDKILEQEYIISNLIVYKKTFRINTICDNLKFYTDTRLETILLRFLKTRESKFEYDSMVYEIRDFSLVKKINKVIQY